MAYGEDESLRMYLLTTESLTITAAMGLEVCPHSGPILGICRRQKDD